MLAPQTLTRWLGLQGQAALVRAYGIREVTNGVALLRAKDPTAWVWGRVAGDALDLATVAPGLQVDHPEKGHVVLALVILAGITVVDVGCGVQLRKGLSR